VVFIGIRGLGWLLILLLAQALSFLAILFDYALVLLNLLLVMLILGLFLALQIIADKRPGAEPEAAANGGTGGRVPDSRADKATGRSSTERADTRTFFSRRK
jgi:hypothetical protein